MTDIAQLIATCQTDALTAVIFDMDGTLVDSERLTAEVTIALLEQHALGQDSLDGLELDGRSWQAISELLTAQYPALKERPIAAQLQQRFHRAFVERRPAWIPGARQAIRSSIANCPTAIVTSSSAQTARVLLEWIDAPLLTIVTAEDCLRSKPAPDGFLLAAQRLACPAKQCLVFEDSAAGLEAAKRAEMTTVLIARGRPAEALALHRPWADFQIDHFEQLPREFFATLHSQASR